MIGVQQGEGPLPLEGPGTTSAGLVAYVTETYQTPLLDLTKTVSNIELVPARPGHVPLMFNGSVNSWTIESVVGTQVTPPTIQAGSDAAHSNFFAAAATSPSNASVNGAVPPSMAIGPLLLTLTPKLIPNAPVLFDITVAASGTGGYSCMARLSVCVTWLAVGLS